MRQSLKSFAIGAASGAITYAASIYTIGYTMAFAMPHGFPLALWDALVVFGLGAALVAFFVHLIAIGFLPVRAAPAFAGFAVAAVLALAVSGQIAFGFKTIAAWLIGTLLASAVRRWLRPNNSFKPNPLRGSA